MSVDRDAVRVAVDKACFDWFAHPTRSANELIDAITDAVTAALSGDAPDRPAVRGGYGSSGRAASTLSPPPPGPAPGSRAALSGDSTPTEQHVLVGDLHSLEYAIADYVAKWGEHWTGLPYGGEFGPNIAGMPVAVANMAMTVIRKNLRALSGDSTPTNGVTERLAELLDVESGEALQSSVGRAQDVLGKRPGIFTVDDVIEARWIIGDLVINVTFSDPPEAYVYDRRTKEVISR